MANEIFVDTSGYYAVLVRQDDRHESARQLLKTSAETRRGFFTTDYVWDETVTLLKARGHTALIKPLLEIVFGSAVCMVVWTDAKRFHAAQSHFLKFLDKSWLFTDCVSFRVMKERKLSDSLTKDYHFVQAGFKALLD